MTARPAEPARPGWKFWFSWMLATFVGAAVGLVAGIPFQLILETAMGGVRPGPWSASETGLIMVFKGAEGGTMGLGMGLGQWLVFRRYLEQTRGWVIATGFALFLQGAFRWSLPFDAPASQVLIVITLSFGVFLGGCQWFVLRGRVPNAGWWIAINFAGWVATFAFAAASEYAQFSIESIPGMVLFAISMILPFAVAGGGMVWLLRHTSPASRPELRREARP